MNNYISYNQMPRYTSSLNINPNTIDYNVSIPFSLMKSIEGKYFVGSADNMPFGNATNAWARLYNPPNSGVNLYVDTWTVSDILTTPYRVRIWFNSTPRGLIEYSQNVTPSNLTIVPQPRSHILLQYAISVNGFPTDGIEAYVRYGLASTTITSVEEGKFIFPPGGSFMVSLSNPERPTVPVTGSVSFGWWEEPISYSL